MRVGEKSHFLLSDYLHALQAEEATSDLIASLKENMKAEMESDFTFSKERDYQNDEDFFGKFGLSEHFYGEDVDDELPLAMEKVCGNLDRFIASSWHSKVQDCFERAKLVYVESPREPDFEAMRVNISKIPALRGISVMASPDFWAIFSDTEYLVVDWKSGKEDVLQEWIPDQLKVYALKMLLKKGYTSLSGVRIEAYEVYLNTMTAYGGVLKQEDIDGVVAKIEKDTELQKNFLVDKNPMLNLPVEREIFRKTTNAKKCESCTFRGVCGKLV